MLCNLSLKVDLLFQSVLVLIVYFQVECLSQFQPTTNRSTVCHNGTWTTVPKCIPAKCTELPDAPRNGMVVAPKLDHGMVGKFECRSFLFPSNNIDYLLLKC